MTNARPNSLPEVEVDVVAVGAGPGGLIAALRSTSRGYQSLIVEKSPYVGGTSAKSFGALWFADNPMQRALGLKDSIAEGLDYLQAAVGDAGPASTRTRQEAYLTGGQCMLSYLESIGLRFIIDHYPDYYPELVGSKADGRMLNSPLFDARALGDWQGWIRQPEHFPLGVLMGSIGDVKKVAYGMTSVKAAAVATGMLLSSYWTKLRGIKPLTLGSAYIGQLLLAAQQMSVPIRLNTKMEGFLVDDGNVVGIIAHTGLGSMKIRARRGVLLDCGGFAHNQQLRDKFGPHPASTAWSLTVAEDVGDAYTHATDLGAAVDNLDEAYWFPLLVGATGQPELFFAERHQPHTMIVDWSGARFTNEASNYMAVGRAMYHRESSVTAVPAWFILDSWHRNRFSLGSCLPRVQPTAWIKSGPLKKADSIGALADMCGIDRHGLESQVARFNDMAHRGVDDDFHRGESAYDRVYGDPSVKPNPCLGPIDDPPYYAVQVVPGDLGMAGGLLTNEHGAVLSTDGTVINGLYACGTAAASVMGRVYAGGGISLGQSSAFGFLAAEHMCSSGADGM
ncbi:FAD-binding protein [Mycobacterium paraintracellulare]|uniref:FAD-binding protein n=1 Tax=Mycobacterium paraintracellulare TaxID=1138383 RepID=UPI0019281E6B|nr:FAD-binding protein [Mycobacterium paraintracellulare]BCP14252.1 3-oxosteroid 1-dehydrogenase [Mycobacterium paraintracellulare]